MSWMRLVGQELSTIISHIPEWPWISCLLNWMGEYLFSFLWLFFWKRSVLHIWKDFFVTHWALQFYFEWNTKITLKWCSQLYNYWVVLKTWYMYACKCMVCFNLIPDSNYIFFFYYLAMNYKYCKTLGITRMIFLSELKVAFQPHESLLLNLIKPADIVFFWILNNLSARLEASITWRECILRFVSYMKHLFDRFDTGEGIVVIGATNFPEVLDKYVSYHF